MARLQREFADGPSMIDIDQKRRQVATGYAEQRADIALHASSFHAVDARGVLDHCEREHCNVESPPQHCTDRPRYAHIKARSMWLDAKDILVRRVESHHPGVDEVG
jgi:hypothetical protein